MPWKLHEAAIRRQLTELLAADNNEAAVAAEKTNDVSLLRAALLIARMDNPDVDVETYMDRIDQWANEIRDSLTKDADEATRLAAMDRYLFEELGVHGSRFEYYTRANSYINEVIEDREGLPITLVCPLHRDWSPIESEHSGNRFAGTFRRAVHAFRYADRIADNRPV